MKKEPGTLNISGMILADVQVVCSNARAMVAGALLSASVAAPAAAQQSPVVKAPIDLSRAVVAGGAAAENVAPAPPAQAEAAKDSATLTFFRGTEFSGFVDLYYGYNFNTPRTSCSNAGGVEFFNCLRNFDVAHNSFSLNLAELALEKKPTSNSRGGFRIDLDYGPTAAVVHAAEPGGTTIFQNVEQAYVSYLAPVGTGVQLDVGKFVTMMGNEVIETKDNWNYSRSLLFALAIPYYHTGARLTYTPNDRLALQGHIVNGWNNVTDNNGAKSIGGSVTFKPTGRVTIVENFMFGPEQAGNNSDWRKMSDTVVSYAAGDQLSLAANYDHGQDTMAGQTVRWHGVAGYLRYQTNDWLAFIPRVEWYKDRDGATTGATQTLKELTLTAELKHKDGVTMRVEYRGDFSDVPYFVKNTFESAKSQNTLTVGFVYAFSTKVP